MSEIVVQPATARHQRQQFLQFPWELYRNDPNWIPPLRRNQQELVGYKPHPFHEHADIQTFIATRNGVTYGRLAAILNHAHNRWCQENIGFVGFFESTDDQAVADGLFGAARSWFSERNVHTIRGPANPSLNYECGLLIEGVDSPPTFMMTYNPPYYERLWEEFGFRKVEDSYAYWGHADMLGSLDQKIGFIRREASRRFNIRRRQLTRRHFTDDVRMFLNIYNKSLVGTWGFVPMSEHEVEHTARSLRHLIVPEMTSIAEVDGRPVGAVFGLLDFNPRIKKIDGRLFPLGFLQLKLKRRALKRVRLISTNVLPEFQRWGVGLVLLADVLPRALEWGVEECEFSWVLESNHLSRASLERGGAIRAKTYRMYDYPASND